MLQILLSFGAIDALIPLLVIIILIAAAAGLTRGYDIFQAFGIGTLAGIAGAGLSGRGSLAGKSAFKAAGKGAGQVFGAAANEVYSPGAKLKSWKEQRAAEKKEKEAMWTKVQKGRGNPVPTTSPKQGHANARKLLKLAVPGAYVVGAGTGQGVGSVRSGRNQQATEPEHRSPIKVEKDQLTSEYGGLKQLKENIQSMGYAPGTAEWKEAQKAMNTIQVREDLLMSRIGKLKGAEKELDVAIQRAINDKSITKKEFMKMISPAYGTFYGRTSQSRLAKNILGMMGAKITGNKTKYDYFKKSAREEYSRSPRSAYNLGRYARFLGSAVTWTSAAQARRSIQRLRLDLNKEKSKRQVRPKGLGPQKGGGGGGFTATLSGPGQRRTMPSITETLVGSGTGKSSADRRMLKMQDSLQQASSDAAKALASGDVAAWRAAVERENSMRAAINDMQESRGRLREAIGLAIKGTTHPPRIVAKGSKELVSSAAKESKRKLRNLSRKLRKKKAEEEKESK